MDVESQIAQLRAAGELKEVAKLAIETYGSEVLRFLELMLRDHANSADAFSQACEDLWKGLPRFEGRASMKTWFYTLARHAASRQRRSAHVHRMTTASEVSALADAVRSGTRPHLKTEVKVGVAAIRETLDEGDRVLLVLRIDRGMSWNDVARVMADHGDEGSDEAVAKAAARLRKRFQTVKESIRARAVASGLIADTGDEP